MLQLLFFIFFGLIVYAENETVLQIANAKSDKEIADCHFCNDEISPPCAVYLKPCNYAPYRCDHLWTGVDFLYWRVCEDGLSGTFGNVSIANTITSTKTTTTFFQTNKGIDFDWDPGFRVAVGLEFAPYSSEIGFYWTRFHQTTKTKEGPNRAHWQLHFDCVDGLYEYRFWYDGYLCIKPNSGLRYAQIHQHLNTNLFTLYTTPTAVTPITTEVRESQKFWSLGPLFGVQADWYLMCGLTLYGTFDGGILYGHFRTEHEDCDTSSTVATIHQCEGNSCACLGVIDLGFGFRYEVQYFTCKMGLEHHLYSDYNQIGGNGNLNLFGFFLGIELHY